MLLRNKARIEELEKHKLENKDSFIFVTYMHGDEKTFKYKDKEYTAEEFEKCYPKATLLMVRFID